MVKRCSFIIKINKSDLLSTKIRGFLTCFSNHFNSLYIEDEEKES